MTSPTCRCTICRRSCFCESRALLFLMLADRIPMSSAYLWNAIEVCWTSNIVKSKTISNASNEWVGRCVQKYWYASYDMKRIQLIQTNRYCRAANLTPHISRNVDKESIHNCSLYGSSSKNSVHFIDASEMLSLLHRRSSEVACLDRERLGYSINYHFVHLTWGRGMVEN